MWSGRLLWTGLTLDLAADAFWPEISFVGKLVMIVGCVLLWLDK